MHQEKIEIPQTMQMFRSVRSQGWRIANLPHIAEVWGGKAARIVQETVRGRSDRLWVFGASAQLSLLSACETLSVEPVVVGGTSLHAVVVAAEAGHAAAPVGLLPSDDTAVELYRDDMRAAAIAFRSLKERQTWFCLQPILDVQTHDILYEEALIRFPGPAGSSPVRYIEAVERLGLAQAFDGQVVSLALARLIDTLDAVLGVNISAQSALPGGWRDRLAAELASRPDVASRLVIEVTESAPLPSILGAKTILRDLRATGCRFALDDFGVGYSSVEYMTELRPDIVKIGGSFIKEAMLCEQGHEIFAAIMRMAKASAKIVVVEGVETAQQSGLADSLGGNFQQGFFHRK